MTRRLIVALACVALTTGCRSWIDRQAAATTYRILERSTVVARRQPDLELARAAIAPGLLQLEAFALAYPDHRGFAELHAEAWCQHAVAFVFDDWEDAELAGREHEAEAIAARLRPLLARCAALELALLPAVWRDARAAGPGGLVALLPTARPAQVGPLLWLATTDAVSIALDPLRNFGKLPETEAILRRCAEIAPGFHDADAELLAATLDANRGAFLGIGDGQAAFDVARARAGEGALIVDVMYARTTLVARRDRAAFVAALEGVLAAAVERWPDRRLSNELARRKARRYLAAVDTFIR